MSGVTTPKSILKAPNPTTTSSREDHNREVALFHANLIQQRKDIELTILLSTETLIDYPLARAPYDASNPSPSDAQTFKSLLRPFQPSDYDALILERNINGHCGYALCPNARVQDNGGGKYRLVGKHGKAKDFRIVDKEDLEKWCSDQCAKRALYVRVQLSESPAWERESPYGVDIDLLDEATSRSNTPMDGESIIDLPNVKDHTKQQDASDLALERGDTGYAARAGMVEVKIKENTIQGSIEAPSLTEDLSDSLDAMHLTLEGHQTSFGSERRRRHHEELADTEGEGFDEDTGGFEC